MPMALKKFCCGRERGKIGEKERGEGGMEGERKEERGEEEK